MNFPNNRAKRSDSISNSNILKSLQCEANKLKTLESGQRLFYGSAEGIQLRTMGDHLKQFSVSTDATFYDFYDLEFGWLSTRSHLSTEAPTNFSN